MGIHMLNPALLDGAVVPRPGLLVYEPRTTVSSSSSLSSTSSSRRLEGAGRPLFGPVHFTGTPNRYGLPAFYSSTLDLEAEPERHPDPVEPRVSC